MRVAIKYERHVHPHTKVPVYSAIVKHPRVNVWDNRRYTETLGVRVIKEGRGYRADFASGIAGTFMPWEPITDTEYRSVAAAKKAVREFIDDRSGPEPKE